MAGASQGSVTVDIRARVTGWENSLKQFQNDLKAIDPGSSLGKSLGKAIDEYSRRITTLSKNPTPEVFTERQLNSLFLAADQVDNLGASIGRMFSNVTVDNLNFAALGGDVANYQQQIDSLINSMNALQNISLKEALKDAPELAASLQNLGINLETSNFNDVKNRLNSLFSSATASVNKFNGQLTETNNKIQALQAEKNNKLESAPKFLSDNNIYEQMLASVQNLMPALGEQIYDPAKAQDIMNKMFMNLQDMANSPELQAAADAIKQKITEAFQINEQGFVDPKQFTAKFQEIFNMIKETAGFDWKTFMHGNGLDLNASFRGNGILAQFQQEIISDNQVEQAKARANELVEALKQILSEQNLASITEHLKNGEISKIGEILVEALRKSRSGFDQEINNYDNQMQTFEKRIEEIRVKLDQATAQRGAVQQASSGYNQLTADINNRLNDFDTRLKALENLRNTAAAPTAGKINTGGENAIAEAARNLHMGADAASQYGRELDRVREKMQGLNKIQGFIQRWFSIYAVVRMVRQAISEIVSTIGELDKTITNISIVTSMSSDELWGQIPEYTAMAQQYGASISGVYEVSQLYYQQGLQTADVMVLTAETLKMAQISGLDYATATNYMTNAIRSFKMEQADANHVVDVYAILAASSASSVEELATAMSKTASSAYAVGASFEETSAMMAVMLEATREAPENIGSALKSIISRYGELKESPDEILNIDGEEISLNKVDKALQTVGISLHDAQGQFRGFGEVIAELSEIWNTLDSNTQRYIATVMAGNRQQSRFLALVSSGERYQELLGKAENSEDTGTLQQLKVMDSVEAKSQQVKNAMESIYNSVGLEKFLKSWYDVEKNILTSFGRMTDKGVGGFILAIGKIAGIFMSLANVVKTVFSIMRTNFKIQEQLIAQDVRAAEQKITGTIQQEGNTQVEIQARTAEQRRAIINDVQQGYTVRIGRHEYQQSKVMTTAATASAAGVALQLGAAAIDERQSNGARIGKGILTGFGGLASGAGSALSTLAITKNPLIAAIMGIVTGLPSLIEAIGLIPNTEERIKELEDELKEKENKSKENKAKANSLEKEIEEWEKLKKSQNESAEAKQAYIDKTNELAEAHPELVSSITAEGDAVIDLTDAYKLLKKAREEASESERDAADTSMELAENRIKEGQQKLAEGFKSGKFYRHQVQEGQEVFVVRGGASDIPGILTAQTNGSTDISHISYGDYGDSTTLWNGKEFVIIRGNNQTAKDRSKDTYKNQTVIAVDETQLQKLQEMGVLTPYLGPLTNIADPNTFNYENVKYLAEHPENLNEEGKKAVRLMLSNYMGKESNRRLIALSEADSIIKLGQADKGANLTTTQNAQMYDLNEQYGSTQAVFAAYLLEQFDKTSNGQEWSDWLTENDETVMGDFIQTANEDDKSGYEEAMEFIGDIQNKNIEDANEWIQTFKDKNKDVWELILPYLQTYYNITDNGIITDFEGYSGTDFVNNFKKLGFKDKNIHIKAVYRRLTKDQQVAFNQVFKKIKDFKDRGIFSEASGNDFASTIMNIITSEVLGDNLSGEQLNEFLDLLLSEDWLTDRGMMLQKVADFESKTGIKITDKLGNLWTDFETQIEDIPRNVETATQNAINQGKKLWKNINEWSKKLYEGMEFEEVEKFLQQYSEFTWGDFEVGSNGKLKLKSGSASKWMQELQKGYNDTQRAISQNSEAIERIDSWNIEGFEPGERTSVSDASGILGIDIASYAEQWVNMGQESKEKKYRNDFKEYLKEQLQQNNDQLTNMAESQLLSTLQTIYGEAMGIIMYHRANKQPGNVDFTKLEELGPITSEEIEGIDSIPEKNIVMEAYLESRKQVVDALLNSYENDEDQYIEVDNFNQQLINDITNGTYGVGDKALITAEAAQNFIKSEDNLAKIYAKDSAAYIQARARLEKLKGSKSTLGIIEQVTSSAEGFDYDVATQLATSFGTDDVDTLVRSAKLLFDDVTGLYTLSSEGIEWARERINQAGLEPKQQAKALIQLDNSYQDDKTWIEAFKDLNNLSMETVLDLIDSLGINYETASALFIDNLDGTYSVTLKALKEQAEKHYKGKIPKRVQKAITAAEDEIANTIADFITPVTRGYTKTSDMRKIVNAVNTSLGKSYSLLGENGLFEWSDVTNTYVLSANGLIAQMTLMWDNIEAMSEEMQQASVQLMRDNARQLADQIDILGYIDSERGIQEQNKIRKSIRDYNAYVKQFNAMPGVLTKIVNGEALSTIDEDALMNAIEEGGQAAVIALADIVNIQHKDLKFEDVKKAYRGKVNQLVDTTAELLTAEVGTVVDGATAEILGDHVTQIGNTGYYVVSSFVDLGIAAQNYYDALVESNAATTRELNTAYAKFLSSKKGINLEQAAIDAAAGGAVMTYEQLADLFTMAGRNFDDISYDILTANNIIEERGGNKILIKDFNQLIKRLGIAVGSPEYTAALSQYNDSLIQYNREAQKNIMTEVAALGEAKPGDQLNFTYFQDAMGKVDAAFITRLEEYGATLKDGILSLETNANIPAIISLIVQRAGEFGTLLEGELLELQQILSTVLNRYVDLIGQGISGSLDAEGLTELQAFAGQDLSFTVSADGLELTNESLLLLYSTMKGIDSSKALKMLPNMMERFTDSADLKTMSGVLAQIARLQQEINNSKQREPTNDAVIASLEREKALYEDIARYQAEQPDSFKFMDIEMPAGMQSAEQYFSAVDQMFTTMSKGQEDGYVTMHDWYAMCSELNHMAALSGQNIVYAGQTFDGSTQAFTTSIENGYAALSRVEGVGLVVDLGSIGANLEAGAEDMSSGIDEGIKAVAASQVSVWEGIVSFLETMVAIEEIFGELQGLDMNGDGTIGFPEIFAESNGDLRPEYKDWFKNEIKGREKVANWLKQFSVETEQGFISAYDILESPEQYGQKAWEKARDVLQAGATYSYDENNLAEAQANLTATVAMKANVVTTTKITTADGTEIVELTDGRGTVRYNKSALDDFFSNVQTEARDALIQEFEEATWNASDPNASLETILISQGYNQGNVEVQIEGGKRTGFVITFGKDMTFETDENGKVRKVGSNKVDPRYQKQLTDVLDEAERMQINGYKNISFDGLEGSLNGKPITISGNLKQGQLDIVETRTVDVRGNMTFKYSAATINGESVDIQNATSIDAVYQAAYEQWAGANAKNSYKLDSEYKNNVLQVSGGQYDIVFTYNTLLKYGKREDIDELQQLVEDGSINEANAKIIEMGFKVEGEGFTQAELEEMFGMQTVTVTAIAEDPLAEALRDRQVEITAHVTTTGDELPTDVNVTTNSSNGQENLSDDNIKYDEISLMWEHGGIVNYGAARDESPTKTIEKPIRYLDETAPTGRDESPTKTIKQPTRYLDETILAEQDNASTTNPITLQSGYSHYNVLEGSRVRPGHAAAPGFDTDHPELTWVYTNHPFMPYNTNRVTLGQPDSQTVTIEKIEESAARDLSAASESTVESNTTSLKQTTDDFTSSQNTELPNIEDLTASLSTLNNIDTPEIEPVVDAIDRVNTALAALNTTSVEESFTNLNNTLGSIDVNPAIQAATAFSNKLNSIPSVRSTTVRVKFEKSASSAKGTSIVGGQNYSFSFAKGNAAFAGGTLMGELGPELVVSNGHYFVVGQNGAEFVNLDSDAIVFNHLQTQRLLNTGHGGRGKPITNEREATSFATGNTSGPAMANAQSALNSARQILAAWRRLADLGMSELGQKAGGGGGGGGGGDKNNAGYIADLERWYTLLRQIEHLETAITYQESLRSKIESDRIIDGRAYYESQKESLKLLDDELSKTYELVHLQRSYYDARRADLENSKYSKIFTFDENGTMIYNDNAVLGAGTQYETKGGLMALAMLNRQNSDNSPVYTAEEQYNILKAWGFEEDLKYDSSGKEIDLSKDDGFVNAVKTFWDKLDGWKEELDELYGSYEDYQEQILKLTEETNKILQAFVDNQISVENRISGAIENLREQEIKNLEDERDAIEKSTEKFIQGLNDALEKERKLYETNESDLELDKMRRRLSILQRSGGSASEIRSLQQEITQRERDQYFQKQQDQIDSIQEAADNERDRLDTQIELMRENLAYQKDHGLLWTQVAEIMAQTPREIEEFLLENAKDLESKSELQIAEDLRTIRSEIEQWTSFRDDAENYIDTTNTHNWETYLVAAKKIFSLGSGDKDEIAAAKTAFDNEYKYSKSEDMAGRAADQVFMKYFGDRPGARPVKDVDENGNPNLHGITIYYVDSDGQKRKISYTGLTEKEAKRQFAIDYPQYVIRQLEAFKEGGLANYTGLALVHGSPQDPEAFLNADETHMWRDKILSGNNGSLTSMLIDFQDMVSGIVNSDSYLDIGANSSGVNIENAIVNMNATISNDYDARRAANTVMDEMVRIARKTTAQQARR